MKTSRIIAILLLVMLPLTAMSQSGLYKKLAQRKGVSVAEVTGFRINDSVKIDVVLMTADDEATWQRLKKEYGITGTAGTTSWLGELEHPEQRARWEQKPVLRIIASHSRKAIGFYRIETDEQFDALIDYQMNAIKKK
jgi:hypothetical protein